MNKTVDALKIPATAQEWTDLTEEQMCALAVHYRVILMSDPKRAKECTDQWSKMPRDLFRKWSQYIIQSILDSKPIDGKTNTAWSRQAEAVIKFGLPQ